MSQSSFMYVTQNYFSMCTAFTVLKFLEIAFSFHTALRWIWIMLKKNFKSSEVLQTSWHVPHAMSIYLNGFWTQPASALQGKAKIYNGRKLLTVDIKYFISFILLKAYGIYTMLTLRNGEVLLKKKGEKNDH